MATHRPSITLMRDTVYMRGLLVEDVDAMRTFLRTVLQGKHTELVEAANLAEARHHLRSGTASCFDFVLLDLELPDGNGLDLTPEIGDGVRIIALTANDGRETELQCLSAGCDVIINKGEDLARLRGIVMNSVSLEPGAAGQNLSTCFPYINYLAETRVELEKARNNVDCLAVRQIAHRLRGTAIHFGYTSIGAAALSISNALAAGRIEQLNTTISVLSARISEAIEAHHLVSQRTTTMENNS